MDNIFFKEENICQSHVDRDKYDDEKKYLDYLLKMVLYCVSKFSRKNIVEIIMEISDEDVKEVIKFMYTNEFLDEVVNKMSNKLSKVSVNYFQNCEKSFYSVAKEILSEVFGFFSIFFDLCVTTRHYSDFFIIAKSY